MSQKPSSLLSPYPPVWPGAGWPSHYPSPELSPGGTDTATQSALVQAEKHPV